MLRNAILSSMLAVALLGAGHAYAASDTAIEGSYRLVQDDSFQRVLSFTPEGNVSQVSDQEALIGFTAGLGTWTRTGPNTVTATLINFKHDIKETDGGDGSARITYELTFSDPQDGKYRAVAGSYTGETFAETQNPLAPTEAPVNTFGTGFSGQRIDVGPAGAEPA
ncbi:MAG: hypothetical protein GY789_18275 [Hyphomicrobiales bacterium]|nr:hypothetical protein [Hyphomicrobiales bacterium]